MCKGQQRQSKCPPQLILVSVFHLHSWCELVLKNNVHRVNQKHDKTFSFPEAVLETHTWGKKSEHKQMSMRANAMKMFLSGTDRQEHWQGTVCSNMRPDEKKHSTILTTADQLGQLPPPRRATSPREEILCKEWQADSFTVVMYVTQHIEK